MKFNHKICMLLPLVVALSGCSALSEWGFTDKSNLNPPAPLVNFQPSLDVAPIWANAPTSGIRSQANPLNLVLVDHVLYAADSAGHLVALNSDNGQYLWKQSIGYGVSSGPVVKDGIVVVTTVDGQIRTFNAINGTALWQAKLTGIAYASPAVYKQFVVAKTIDGRVSIFAKSSGTLIWQYNHQEPSFVESGDSSPQFANHVLILGFSDGRLLALNPDTQKLLWELPVSMPASLQESAQMVGIVADPVVSGNRVYAVTYQGNLVAVNVLSGQPLWSKPLSAYQDFSVFGDTLYLSDANSHVYAINGKTGAVIWHQDQLDSRSLTMPVYISAAKALVVGDAQGYLHFLSANDGHFIARVRVANSAILTAPVVSGQNIYVLTRTGRVTAYLLKP